MLKLLAGGREGRRTASTVCSPSKMMYGPRVSVDTAMSRSSSGSSVNALPHSRLPTPATRVACSTRAKCSSRCPCEKSRRPGGRAQAAQEQRAPEEHGRDGEDEHHADAHGGGHPGGAPRGRRPARAQVVGDPAHACRVGLVLGCAAV